MDVDALVGKFDRVLRVLSAVPVGGRPTPGGDVKESALSDSERRLSAGLMRVNHVGEVCAQALYESQGAFAGSAEMKAQMRLSREEEEDHLAWTAQRLAELGSRPSLLNPFWYAGAYTLGMLASRGGDPVSLGFVVETEKQVEEHLDEHLKELPAGDLKSRAIVDQMRLDEIAHGSAAKAMGAATLPLPVTLAMRAMAKVMTRTAYYI